MRKLLLSLATGLALLGLGWSAYSQVTGLFPTAISGQEVVEATVNTAGPGGSGEYMTINMIRGGTPQVVGTMGGAITIGVTSANFTVTGTPLMPILALSGGNLLITAQPTAGVITMPANPILDGAIYGICNASSAAFSTNAVTLAANSNQTLAVAATLTTLAAGTCAREQWNQAAATWYRIQ